MLCIGYEQIDCNDSVVQAAADVLTIPEGAVFAEIQAQREGDINYTMDGTTSPGSSRGMILRSTGSPILILIENLKNMQFVKNDEVTKLNVQYYTVGRII